MAPIAASSESKSKLRVFQYNQKDATNATKLAVTEKEDEKENRDPYMGTTVVKMDPPPQPLSQTTATKYLRGCSQTPVVEMEPPPQPLSQTSATKDLRGCPQTPVGKLPLTDLLASGDGTSRQHVNVTPIERVLWNNSPVGSESAYSRKKGRKRAHSSSSASSSPNDASHHFGGSKPQFNLQELQKAFQTPKADPADDLWSRYSLNTGIGGKQSPTAPASLTFTQLVHSSSPQTPASHLQSKEGGGLRRALSCIEWPTSAAKRRRLQLSGTYKDSNGGSARNERGPDAKDNSKMSRVSFLVGKIHDGLTKPSATEEFSSSMPAASSPMARIVNDLTDRDQTLQQTSQTAIDEVVTVLSQTAVALKEHTTPALVLSAEEIADLEKDDESSDFGDDDLDLEMLETMDATLKTFPSTKEKVSSPERGRSQLGSGGATTTVDRNPGIREPCQNGNALATAAETERLSQVSFPSGISSSPVLAAASNHDEFDEDDEEVSAVDLENVFARYDIQPQKKVAGDEGRQENALNAMHTTLATEISRKSIFGPMTTTDTEVQILSDDSDFGDDVDFEQIAAECAEDQQVSQPVSSVRTVNKGSSMF